MCPMGTMVIRSNKQNEQLMNHQTISVLHKGDGFAILYFHSNRHLHEGKMCTFLEENTSKCVFVFWRKL